jgi:hypothetical protein
MGKQLCEFGVIMIEVHVVAPVIDGDESVFVVIEYAEQFLTLLFGDIG